MDCGIGIYEEDSTYWANLYSKLSFNHLLQKESDFSNCVEAISPYSHSNWNKLMNTISTVRLNFGGILVISSSIGFVFV